MRIGSFLLLSVALVLAPSVPAHPASPPSPERSLLPISVPRGDGTPVITDGQFSPGEWDDALRIVMQGTITLHLKQVRDVVFIGIRGSNPLDIGPSELLLAAPGGPVYRLHVSAQLGEMVVPADGAAPPFRFGLTTDWYANELRRDEAKFEQLREEGKPPIDVMRGSAYPVDGIEFAIRRAKVAGTRWLLRVNASAMIDGKPGGIIYPPGSVERTTDGWLELKLR